MKWDFFKENFLPLVAALIFVSSPAIFIAYVASGYTPPPPPPRAPIKAFLKECQACKSEALKLEKTKEGWWVSCDNCKANWRIQLEEEPDVR